MSRDRPEGVSQSHSPSPSLHSAHSFLRRFPSSTSEGRRVLLTRYKWRQSELIRLSPHETPFAVGNNSLAAVSGISFTAVPLIFILYTLRRKPHTLQSLKQTRITRGTSVQSHSTQNLQLLYWSDFLRPFVSHQHYILHPVDANPKTELRKMEKKGCLKRKHHMLSCTHIHPHIIQLKRLHAEGLGIKVDGSLIECVTVNFTQRDLPNHCHCQIIVIAKSSNHWLQTEKL